MIDYVAQAKARLAKLNKRPTPGEQKFNGGTGALLCPKCKYILAYGFHHRDVYKCPACGSVSGPPVDKRRWDYQEETKDA